MGGFSPLGGVIFFRTRLTLRIVTSGRLSDLCGLTFIGPANMSFRDSTAACEQAELDQVASVGYMATNETETWSGMNPHYRVHGIPASYWKRRTPSLNIVRRLGSCVGQRSTSHVARYARVWGDATASVGVQASVGGYEYIKFSSKSEMGSLCNERPADSARRQI